MARENFSPQPNGQIVRDGGVSSAALAGYFNNLDIVEASRLLGRGSDNGVGVTQYLTLGSGLQLVDRELSIDFTPMGGDVIGPTSATDGFVPIWDGSTGKLLKNSTVNGAWFNQALLTSSTPTFAGVVTTALTVNGFGFTVTGAPSLDNWFNQSVKSTASPTFNALTLTSLNVNTFAVTVLGATTLNDWFDQSVKVAASPTFNSLTLTSLTVNTKTVTVNGNTVLDNWFDQSVKVAASPSFANLTVSSITAASYKTGASTGAGATAVLSRDGGGTWSLKFENGIMTEAIETP